MVIASIVTANNMEYEGYIFPSWATLLGWGIALSSMIFVPLYAIYKFLSVPGTFKQVSIALILTTFHTYSTLYACIFIWSQKHNFAW